MAASQAFVWLYLRLGRGAGRDQTVELQLRLQNGQMIKS